MEPLVLIVDDNAKNLKLARDVLQAAGLRTLEAETGAEGIALAERARAGRRPDGPPASGHGRRGCGPGPCGRTRRRRTSPSSRSARCGSRTRCSSPGFAGYVEKPIDIASFPDQVRSYCGLTGGTCQSSRRIGMLARWTRARLHVTIFTCNEAGNPKEVREDVEAATLVEQELDLARLPKTGVPSSCWPRSGSPYRLHPRRTRRPEGRRHSTRQRTARDTPGSRAPTARSGPRTSRRSRWARRSSTSSR